MGLITEHLDRTCATFFVNALAFMILVPWQVLLSAGVTFAASSRDGWPFWLFVLSACLLDVPAIILGFFKPVSGFAWFLLNTATTCVIIVEFYERNGAGIYVALGSSYAIWAPKAIYIAGMAIAFIVQHRLNKRYAALPTVPAAT